MNVVGHGYECVQFVGSFKAIVLKRIEEELRVAFDLEKPPAVCGDCGNEEGTVGCGSQRFCHGVSLEGPTEVGPC